MTTGLPLPSPLNRLVGKMDQDILLLGNKGKHALGRVCVSVYPRKGEVTYQALGTDDIVLLEMYLTES